METTTKGAKFGRGRLRWSLAILFTLVLAGRASVAAPVDHQLSLSLSTSLSPSTSAHLSAPPQPTLPSQATQLQLLFTSTFALLTPKLGYVTLPDAAPTAPASSASLNALDRTVIGNRSHAAASLSDGLLLTALTAPLAASLIDSLLNDAPGRRLSGFGQDALILLETFSVSALACNLVKYSVRRPRPYTYDPEVAAADRAAPEGQLSFFSGHTALSFSMATAYSYLFTRRHPDSPAVVPIWIGTHLLASATAAMRVMAGKHFWSDVLVGAAVGSAVGLLVPMLRDSPGLLGRVVGERGLFAAARVTPSFQRGGFGANLMLWF